MLQQTQVRTVIDYFNRFIEAFPDVETLAKAPSDQVMQLWAGLGYYRRARYCHQAAKQMVEKHQATLPESIEALMTLPGIGRSTAGAIRSMAYGQPAAILDGNVKRVFCRFFAIEGPPQKIEKRLWQKAEALLPQTACDVYTQALMDLGATCCTKRHPNCDACPLTNDCLARQKGLQTILPIPASKSQTIPY